MRGGIGRTGLRLVLGLTLLACNTFDERADDGIGDPGTAPTAGFGGFFGGSAGSGAFTPALPTPILQVLRRVPEPNATNVDPQVAIAITFTLPVATNFKAVTLRDPEGGEIPCIETHEGVTLRFRPTRPLELGTTYRVELTPMILATDVQSVVHIPAAEQTWTFTTRAPGETIDLGLPLTRVTYHASTHRMFGIAPARRILGGVDLATGERMPEHTLASAPDDLCVSPDGKRVFLVYLRSAIVTEHEAATLEQVREIPWPLLRHEALEMHTHVRCTEKQLLLVDGQWEPSLWTLALDAGAPLDRTMAVRGIGDLVPTSDGEEFYYWRQIGWNAGAVVASDVRRVALVDLTELDKTDLNLSQGGPPLTRDPLEAPIFLDEAHQRVITHNFVFDSLDLTRAHFEFDKVETFYAVDPTRQRAASKLRIYSLETFMPIGETLSARATQQFFDRDGALYFLVENSLLVQRF